ncbi:MAG: uracil-DNA glycosylase [Gemmatimonadales bacterium]|nr:uracil-DNA glycosylase [Gemmatimonadales bacterium]
MGTDMNSDLLAWIRQQQDQGMEWFLDEGMPQQQSVATPTQNPAPVPVPQTSPVVTSATDKDDPFAQTCQSFVAATLELIQRHNAQTEFNPAAESEAAEAGLPETLEQIQAEVTACRACPLYETRTNTVFGAGNPASSLVFIGEAPGADEDRQGKPFVGKSGQLLGKIIEAIGFGREDVFICNILKCRPPNNRDPQAVEVAACENYLKRQLTLIRPRVICCLGRVAAQTLLGTSASLGKLRKTVHFYEGIPVLATYHPAALLRNPGWKRDTWEDVRKLRALHDALSE